MTVENFLCMCQRIEIDRETRNSHLAIVAWCFPFSRGVLTPISTKNSYLTSLFPGLLSSAVRFYYSAVFFISFAIITARIKKLFKPSTAY